MDGRSQGPSLNGSRVASCRRERGGRSCVVGWCLSRVDQLLRSVDPAARAELIANRRSAEYMEDAWYQATTMDAEVSFHVLFDEGC